MADRWQASSSFKSAVESLVRGTLSQPFPSRPTPPITPKKAPVSSSSLDVAAVNALVADADRRRERADRVGAPSYARPQTISVNKRFLLNTLLGTGSHNDALERGDRPRSPAVDPPAKKRKASDDEDEIEQDDAGKKQKKKKEKNKRRKERRKEAKKQASK